MTFDQYVAYIGTSENLGREGGLGPRKDYSAFFREAFEKARLTDAQEAALGWLVGGVWTADTSKPGSGVQRIETRYQWADNGAYIRFNSHFVTDKETRNTYDGQFFWSPAESTLAMWYMDPANEITKGMENWKTIGEELYNNIKVYETAKPLAYGEQGKSRNMLVWMNDYHGTRVFSTTLGHNNETVGDARYLDLVTRGLLWSVNKPI